MFALIKRFLQSAAIACAAALLAPAHAAVVNFSAPADNATQNTTFADGVFSTNLGPAADGFFTINSTTAFNGYGQDGEYITFNSGVTFNSLVLDRYCGCTDDSTSVTVSLFDSSAGQLASQIWNSSDGARTLTFDTPNVSKVLFNIADPNRSWYRVSDITYSVAAIPEPETYATLLVGLSLVGFVARRRRRSFLAA